MSERRFVITKWDAPINARLDAEAITESELKRRFDACWRNAISQPVPDPLNWEPIFDILLHGEGKEEPRIKDQLVRLNGTDNPEPVQPDPWKAWVENCPSFPVPIPIGFSNRFRAWFRKMPRVKEQPEEPPIITMSVACPKCGGTEYQCAECLEKAMPRGK